MGDIFLWKEINPKGRNLNFSVCGLMAALPRLCEHVIQNYFLHKTGSETNCELQLTLASQLTVLCVLSKGVHTCHHELWLVSRAANERSTRERCTESKAAGLSVDSWRHLIHEVPSVALLLCLLSVTSSWCHFGGTVPVKVNWSPTWSRTV